MSGLGALRPSHDPYIFLWNLQVQRQLPGDLMISVGYVGNAGHHLFQNGGYNFDHVPTATRIQNKTHTNPLVPPPADLVAVGFPANYSQSQFLLPYPQWTYAQPAS